MEYLQCVKADCQMLIGRDLLARQPQSSSLPETGGLKRHWRDASKDGNTDGKAGAEVNLAMARWHLTLTEERSAQPSQLADGEWLPEKRHVTVPGRARFSGQFGKRQLDGSTLLQPEEALILMELGRLIVRLGGMPLSMQQAYQTLISSPAEFKHWLAYSRLVRIGYRLVRHAAKSSAAGPVSAESQQFVLDLSGRTVMCIDPDLPSSSTSAADCLEADLVAECDVKSSSRVSSWAEYRTAAAAAATSVNVPQFSRRAQAASFPSGESLRPLIPWQDLLVSDCAEFTTAEARQRMTVPEIPREQQTSPDCHCAVCCGQLTGVHFNVFRPGHRRRRTAAGVALPDYHLVVVDVDSPPPCPVGVRTLQLTANGGVSVDLLFAIVDDASVHYQVCSTFSVENIHYVF